MNLTITKEQILAGLQAVQNVVSTRTTLPILSNVLMRAEKDRVEFTATDLDVTIACSVEAKVKKAGATTVPVKKLFGIVRELNGSEIEIVKWTKKTSAPSAAARRFTKSTDWARMNFRRCQNSRTTRKLRSRRKTSAQCCTKRPSPFPPTNRATSSTAFSSASRNTR